MLYFFFVLTTRCESNHLMFIILLCFVLYIINLFHVHHYYDLEKEVKKNKNIYRKFWPSFQELKNIIEIKIKKDESLLGKRVSITPGKYLMTKRGMVFIYILMVIILFSGMYQYWKKENANFRPPKNLSGITYIITFVI